jgi:heme/copper-type cytochrome/quinol oxidase subunit 2
MHISTSPKRKSFTLVAVLGTFALALAAAVALIAGVTPARAANIATQADAQVAVFMVPLTLLVLVLLFEVARFVRRDAIPAETQPRRQRRTDWSKPKRD